MAVRELLLTLRIKVSDLTDEKRAEYAGEMEMTAEDLPTIEDMDASQVAERVAEAITGEGQEDFLWAGSDDYATLTEAEVVSAAWS